MGKVFGVIVGLVVMIVVYIAVLLLSPIFHPVPVGLDPSDQAGMGAWVASMPLSGQAATVASWLLGAFAGGWVAMLIGRWAPAAWTITAMMVILAVAQIFRFDYPMWMRICAVVAPLLGGWLSIRLGTRAADSIDS
ncbi:MAG: hypothetical protein EOP62_05815 [Sphingomonadales bacterium]|nr:MAG: hypothetical protein EOP62_05815 [Sphingomonadales bacterium]